MSVSSAKSNIKFYKEGAQPDAWGKEFRRTASGVTDYFLPSDKDVFLLGLFRIQRYCNTGAWLNSTAEDSVVHRNRGAIFRTIDRGSHSIPRIVRRSAQIVSAMFSPRRIQKHKTVGLF
jgi:hypothetical protein